MNALEQIDRLVALATKWRLAMEQADRSDMGALRTFPNGACGDASLLLAKYLADHGEESEYVCGRLANGATHAWLEVRGIVVDITTDQFDEGPRAAVFVAQKSAWHANLSSQERHAAVIQNYDDRTATTLEGYYATILKAVRAE